MIMIMKLWFGIKIICPARFIPEAATDVWWKKGILKNFAKFTGKQMCQSVFFNKVSGLRSAFLLKKRLWHRCFHVNFAKFLRTPFLQNTCGGYFCHSECLLLLCKKWSLIHFWPMFPFYTPWKHWPEKLKFLSK